VAEKIAQTYCLTSQQVYELCNELYLGSDKLALAKFCYGRCYDPQNYEVVYRALSISSMVRELDNFIKQQAVLFLMFIWIITSTLKQNITDD
jgi:hypothetical protein